MIGPDQISESEWQAAGERGNRTIRLALVREFMRAANSGKPSSSALAVGFGALAAIGDLFHVFWSNGGVDSAELERMAIAYLRGALRGAENPITDDGREWREMPE